MFVTTIKSTNTLTEKNKLTEFAQLSDWIESTH